MYGVEYFNFIQRLKLQEGGHRVCRAIYSDSVLSILPFTIKSGSFEHETLLKLPYFVIMNEEIIQEKLRSLQEDLLAKFDELKSDNQKFKLRLKKIEEKLGLEDLADKEVIEEEIYEIRDEDPDEKTIVGEEVPEEIPDDLEEEFEDEDDEVVLSEPEDESKPEPVQLEKLPASTFQGFCFRPLAGWKNSRGRHEISKEWICVNQDEIELKICGFESGEEIARINIPLKDVEKVEASFEEKTILFLFVERDICEAATQSLAMTNISSFSLIDKDAKKIRICFEKITDQRKALLREYFRRNAIFFRFLSKVSQDRIFFKPINKPPAVKYDSNKPLPLDDFVKTVKSMKFLDRVTYTCKVCQFYNESKDTVIRHVNRFHIAPRENISDRDVLVQYIKCK